MFEIIGLLISTAFLLFLACCLGLIYAVCAWLILPKPVVRQLLRIMLGFLIPLVSVSYLWLCTALLPGQSLFGDIDQRLPNGYSLTALGKMPEYGSIANQNAKAPNQGVRGSVDMLAVKGALVIGRYCQSCNPAFVQSKEPYFVLDTRSGVANDYHDVGALQMYIGQPIQLKENQFFHSQEPDYLRQQRSDSFIMFTPPILATILYFSYLIRVRRHESTRL